MVKKIKNVFLINSSKLIIKIHIFIKINKIKTSKNNNQKIIKFKIIRK